MGAAPGVGMDEAIAAEIVETTASPDIVKLWPWVNQVRAASGSQKLREHSCQ